MSNNKNKHDKIFITDFFQSIKLRPARDDRQFWSQLFSKYDKKTIEELGDILDRRAHEGDGEGMSLLYEVKNQTLALSIDFSSFSADLYRRFFEWYIAAYDKRPNRILDLGCDNGIVSCFLAKFFPDSEIIGIDISNNSIKCAQELSHRLRLDNIKFEKVSLFNLPEEYFVNKFDMIFSVRSMHEIFGHLPEFRHWSIKDWLNQTIQNEKFSQISLLFDLLTNEGQFITFERFTDPGQLVMLSKIMGQYQLYPNWDQSNIVYFHEVGDKQSFPAIPFHKKPLNGNDIVNQIYHLYTKDENIRLEPRNEYEGFIAEAIFAKFTDRFFVKGAHVNYKNGSGIMRYEVWNTPNLLLVYECTNIGLRLLRIIDREETGTTIDQLDLLKAHFGEHATVTFFYSLEERDLLEC